MKTIKRYKKSTLIVGIHVPFVPWMATGLFFYDQEIVESWRVFATSRGWISWRGVVSYKRTGDANGEVQSATLEIYRFAMLFVSRWSRNGTTIWSWAERNWDHENKCHPFFFQKERDHYKNVIHLFWGEGGKFNVDANMYGDFEGFQLE